MMLKENNKIENKKLIVVLGMHRSGTSAITRGLQVLGVNLGDNLMPPVEGNNAKGFFEDLDLNALNVELLQTLRSDWDYLSPIEDSDVEKLRKNGYFLRGVEILNQKFSNTSTFGFKDPRVAKLLPFWKQVFAYCKFDVGYVLAVRHPLSVVKSLEKRDGFDSEKSYMLWIGHVLASISNTEEHKCVIVDYDLLMQAPERELGRIADCFDLIVNPDEMKNYRSEFLDEGLRHTVYTLNDLILDDACHPLVSEIYTALLDVAIDRRRMNDVVIQNQVALWSNEFKRLKSILCLIDKLTRKITILNQVEIERDGQISSLNQLVVERDAQISSLNQTVVEGNSQIMHQEKELTAYHDQTEEYIKQLNLLQEQRTSELSNIKFLTKQLMGLFYKKIH
ncbi:sulfotransferase family protein [Desulfitobacterium metallireducens]|uniref:Glycosyl transferase family 1 n=1 Tax=Desulfitobacterium metallireducens DSM 15288 TaxID=871968 RepID=W0EG78_9FIRM|nr:sulfotransferase family protein [Desulfitobacterium metallireducens]AHF08076.1 glycosyl transferase family 1 [Desulfitobacterium metallireducens DSM 15288]